MAAGLSTLAKRTLAQLQVQRAPEACGTPTLLPADLPTEEESVPDYNPKDFYPVNPGELLHNRYETIAKVGWGSCSTVWLARDLNRWRWQPNRYVVLKVNNCDFPDKESAEHELNISRYIATANPLHKGFSIVRTIIDHFEAVSLDGTHRRFKDGKLPLVLLKAYLKILLPGLDYLHSECHIVHTDLKLDNIMVEFEDPSVLEDFSHNDFGPLRSLYSLPKIADFGNAQQNSPQPRIHPIQPDHYRAPEVILGTGWTYSADIWNLGVLIWNLVENRDLFRQIPFKGVYSPHAHLAEMIALLGPPPKALLEREKEARKWKWRPVIQNPEGKLYESVQEYFGGPFFDSKGKLCSKYHTCCPVRRLTLNLGEFIRKDLIPSGLNLLDSAPSLEGEEKRLFFTFVRKMLQWLPEDRKTAMELLKDPWLS
ncbi:hypothetical protein MMC30_004757 [Trapelia coarctata]|nr:hypothetical protein [Trapelia coarctata]